MKCPVCNNVDLLMAERHGVEIDYCPSCRGVWLDRGELDKIIERAGTLSAEQPSAGAGPDYRRQEQPTYRTHDTHPDHRNYSDHGYSQGKPYKKKKSLLSEIFDFD